MKVLVWKRCQRGLPVYANLVKRRIAVDVVCFRCHKGVKTKLHALRDYPCSSEVWTQLGFSWDIGYDDIASLTDWLSSSVKRMNQKQIQSLLLTCWALWMSRNRELHGEDRRSLMAIIEFINKYQNELNDVQTSPPLDEPGSEWVPPSMNYVKVNFDASMQEQQGRCGIGVVIQNHTGQIMAVGAFKMEHVTTIFLADAIAARKALEFASDLGFSFIILEGDSMCIVKSLQANEQNLSPIGPVIKE
ncbi:hypothetical protein REPUB_Repub06bG0091300 [Reevesia pubescens]